MIIRATGYACRLRERSAHVKKLNQTLNDTCRLITDCLESSNTNSIYVLAGIGPQAIR